MTTRILVKANGSYRVEGDFEIFDHTGAKFDLSGRTRVSLCRCGKSATMPFCDSSHKTNGFASEVVARVLPPPKPEQ